MSSILHTIAIAVGGILAGLALAAALLWRQQQALRAARYQATHDEITGLPNRRLFLTRLRAALENNAPVGVVLLDLNRFKTVNDTLGHEVGNDLLHQVGRRLTSLGGPVRVAARLSGDEFALLVTGDREDTAAAADAAWQAIAADSIRVVNGDLQVTASVGYTHTHHPNTSTRQLLTQADRAMYEAKRVDGGVREYLSQLTPAVRSRSRHDG
ncbi:GGDEF domain-containing protein [Micromonospora sp. DR5-3]|uniref:GGDEF domain-containing protein n=1 Tax=unclassified Micromonospora TaxID=2617518 RepID=UPI0011DBF4E0|nr:MULTISPECIES: GGDEF domain-containing protein [unclassified Micromonospora]MCW3818597.1 GGDEF domain-containing protein [Micromonospora sp. DR5-3]TYC20054.1 GGDEF domain-containing protein [Micromonospora sp. MP36]